MAEDAMRSLACYVPRVAAEWDLTAPGSMWRDLDASLVFVDISGFTALSERLARQGRVGAEELTHVLNRVFSGMLAIAYDQGGSLLKFGGDALLLLFPEDQHAVRAVHAAIAMRGALRQADAEPSSVGRLRLRMSVGVHSGRVHLFRVGTSHHELLVAGPAASTTVQMEQTADAGEIVVSSATAEKLHPTMVGDAKGPGWLLRARRAVLDGPGVTTRIPVPEDTIGACVPVALRDHLRAATVEPEHRLATVAFVKYLGVDDLLASKGAGDAAKALHETISAIQASVDEAGVTLLASDLDDNGGKVILTAGVPGAKDDDEGRMLNALRGIVSAQLPLPVKVGVNRGHVFAGDIGTEFRRTFTVMGDTVNLAARLMAASPAGTILATPDVLDRAGTAFDVAAVPPFHVKGKTDPVQAFSVGPALGTRRDVRSTSPFVGRDTELAELERLLADATTRTGRVVLVEADRGAGKSRLVDELLAHHSNTTTVVLRGEPYGGGTPYLPFHQPLGELLGAPSGDHEAAAAHVLGVVAALDVDLLPYAPLLAPVLGLPIPSTPEAEAIAPEFRRDRVAEVLLRLADSAVERGLLVIIEDAHWFDDASSSLAERLVAGARERRWMVVVTRRPVPTGFQPASAEPLALDPLDDRSSRQLVGALTAAAPLRPHQNDAIVGRAAGNPLFLEELVRVARSAGVASLPESLDAAATADIDRLPPNLRQVLRYAAVLGQSFDRDLLRDLLAHAELVLDASIERSVETYLLPHGDDRLQFRHGLLRDAAYESLPFRRRRELHAVAATVIEGRADADPLLQADVLAMHFSRAHVWDKTWHYALQAGREAKRVFAPHEAVLHFERALDAARMLPGLPAAEVAACWAELGEARVWLGYYAQAEESYRRAAGLVAADPVSRAGYVEQRARVVGEHERRHTAAIRLLHGALESVQSMERPDATAATVRLLAREAEIRSRQGRFDDALSLCRSVIEQASSVAEPRALAMAYSITDEALSQVGRIDEAHNLPLALELYEQLGDLQKVGATLTNLGAIAYYQGSWGGAAAYYRRGVDALHRAGDAAGVANCEANLGELFANQGRLQEAEEVLRPATVTLRALGYSAYERFPLIQLGRVVAGLGRDSEALDLLGRAVELDDGAGGRVAGVEARAYLAEAHALAGRPQEALATVAEARRRAAVALDGTPLGAMLDRAEATALVMVGERDAAIERIDRAIPDARAAGSYFDLAVLLALRTELADDGWEQAAERDELLQQFGITQLPLPALTPNDRLDLAAEPVS